MYIVTAKERLQADCYCYGPFTSEASAQEWITSVDNGSLKFKIVRLTPV